MPSSIEKKWLEYSWRLVTDDEHLIECKKNGGKGIDDKELRWPGYLGENYKEGGVVFIGNIHRNFNSGGAVNGDLAERLISNLRYWISQERGSITDSYYLAGNRANYLEGFSKWRISYCFKKFLDAANLTWKDITYINAAKCQSIDGPEKKLQKLCLKRHSLTDLFESLKPSVVLTGSSVARDLNTSNTPFFLFNTRNCLNSEQSRIEEWLPKAVQTYKSAQEEISRKNLIDPFPKSQFKDINERYETVVKPIRDQVERIYENRDRRSAIEKAQLITTHEAMDMPRSWADEHPNRSILCVAECGFSMLSLYSKHYRDKFNCYESAKYCNKTNEITTIEPVAPIYLIPRKLFRTSQKSLTQFQSLVLRFLELTDLAGNEEVFINLTTGGDTIDYTMRDAAILSVFEDFFSKSRTIKKIIYALERNHFPSNEDC